MHSAGVQKGVQARSKTPGCHQPGYTRKSKQKGTEVQSFGTYIGHSETLNWKVLGSRHWLPEVSAIGTLPSPWDRALSDCSRRAYLFFNVNLQDKYNPKNARLGSILRAERAAEDMILIGGCPVFYNLVFS